METTQNFDVVSLPVLITVTFSSPVSHFDSSHCVVAFISQFQVDCEWPSEGSRIAIRYRVSDKPISHLSRIPLRDAVQVSHVHFRCNSHQPADPGIQLHRCLDHLVSHPNRFLDDSLYRYNDRQACVSVRTVLGGSELHQALITPHLHPGPVAIVHAFDKPSIYPSRPFPQYTIHHLLRGKRGNWRIDVQRGSFTDCDDPRG